MAMKFSRSRRWIFGIRPAGAKHCRGNGHEQFRSDEALAARGGKVVRQKSVIAMSLKKWYGQKTESRWRTKAVTSFSVTHHDRRRHHHRAPDFANHAQNRPATGASSGVLQKVSAGPQRNLAVKEKRPLRNWIL